MTDQAPAQVAGASAGSSSRARNTAAQAAQPMEVDNTGGK